MLRDMRCVHALLRNPKSLPPQPHSPAMCDAKQQNQLFHLLDNLTVDTLAKESMPANDSARNLSRRPGALSSKQTCIVQRGRTAEPWPAARLVLSRRVTRSTEVRCRAMLPSLKVEFHVQADAQVRQF